MDAHGRGRDGQPPALNTGHEQEVWGVQSHPHTLTYCHDLSLLGPFRADA